jgi:hypothetical protein
MKMIRDSMVMVSSSYPSLSLWRPAGSVRARGGRLPSSKVQLPLGAHDGLRGAGGERSRIKGMVIMSSSS